MVNMKFGNYNNDIEAILLKELLNIAKKHGVFLTGLSIEELPDDSLEVEFEYSDDQDEFDFLYSTVKEVVTNG